MIVQAPTKAGWTSQAFGSNPGGYNPPGGHTGEDIALPIGTPLRAMADGIVVHVGTFSGEYWDNPWLIMPGWAGFVVTVDYGGFLSHYCHCSGSPVRVGQKVKRGQIVALSGNSGGATSGPHCHWEVQPDGWNNGNGTYGRINPRSVLTTNTVQTLEEMEDPFAMYTDKERAEILAAARLINARAKYLDAPVSAVPTKILDTRIDRKGPGRTGVTTPRNAFAYLDSNLDAANDDAGRAGVPAATPAAGK